MMLPAAERIRTHFVLTRNQGYWLITVAGLGLLLHILLAYLAIGMGSRLLVGDERYYLGIARDIASGIDPQYDWLWPQLYGQSIGWLFQLIGMEIVWVVVCQIILAWLAGWALFALTLRLLDQRTALVVASLYWLSPEIAAFSHYFWPEVLHLFLWVAVWWLVSHQKRPLLCAPFAGLLLGLALLSKLLILPFIPVFFGLVLWLASGRFSRRFAIVSLMGICCAALIVPVIQHNYHHYGLRHIADSSQLNLYLGLTEQQRLDYINDRAPIFHAEFNKSGDTMAERNAIFKKKVTREWARYTLLERLQAQLAVQYFRLFSVETFFTSQLPGGPRASYAFDSVLVGGCLKAAAATWHLLILAMAPVGLLCIQWRRRTWLWLPLLWLLFNLGLFLWVHVKTRYLIQVQPSLVLFAGIGINAIWRKYRGQCLPSCLQWSHWRLIGAALVAVSLWYLALVGVMQT